MASAGGSFKKGMGIKVSGSKQVKPPEKVTLMAGGGAVITSAEVVGWGSDQPNVAAPTEPTAAEFDRAWEKYNAVKEYGAAAAIALGYLSAAEAAAGGYLKLPPTTEAHPLPELPTGPAPYQPPAPTSQPPFYVAHQHPATPAVIGIKGESFGYSTGWQQVGGWQQGDLAMIPNHSANGYDIAHVPSGQPVIGYVGNFATSGKLMQALNESGIVWEAPNPQAASPYYDNQLNQAFDLATADDTTNCPNCGKLMNPKVGCKTYIAVGAVAPPVAGLTTASDEPGGQLTSGKALIGIMFHPDYKGDVYTLPGAAGSWSLPAGKHLNHDNAYQYGVDLPDALAQVKPAGSKNYIVSSGAWLNALQQNEGDVAHRSGAVRMGFVAGDGTQHTAYASVTPRSDEGDPGAIHSTCTCGTATCEHQLLAQAHVLSTAAGAGVMSSGYHQQQMQAPPPVGLASYEASSPTSVLKAQDSFYRSLQNLDIQQVAIYTASPTAMTMFEQASLPVSVNCPNCGKMMMLPRLSGSLMNSMIALNTRLLTPLSPLEPSPR